MAEGRFFGRLLSGLHKTRQALKENLEAVFSRKRIDTETLEELEEALILADLGVQTAEKVLQEVNKRVKQKTIEAGESLRAGVVETLRDILLAATPTSAPDMTFPRPWVLMMVGVNGVGKTTTLGKFAYQLRAAGETPLLVAADTFRAAAIEQAELWAKRAGVDIIKGQPGGDAGAPHDTWLVLDATTGQNGIAQVQQFHDSLGLTGLVLTKLDGTAKGGIVINIAEQFHVPIRYIGIGEGMDDLRPFDAAEFARALLEKEDRL